MFIKLKPPLPFGGYKSSGIGCENSIAGVHDFTRLKDVWIETQPSGGDPLSVKL